MTVPPVAMKVKPLNRAHIAKVVQLHRESKPWLYRGKESRLVLASFYDAHANRDFTIGAVAVDDGTGDVVGVVCGATSPLEADRWLRKRRPWRSLLARVLGGPDLARGGWPASALRRAYICSIARSDNMPDSDLAELLAVWGAAAASRGAEAIYVPAGSDAAALAAYGFIPAGRNGPGLLVKAL